MKEQEFKDKIKNDIQEINAHYKACKGNIILSEEELKLKNFLSDIWTLRLKKESQKKYYEKAVVFVMFMDKDNLSNVVCKNYRLDKMEPKLKTTVPLYHLLYELAVKGEYHCFFVPNIFVFKKGAMKNCNENVKASNTYFVDIDKIETGEEKPLYNCTREEILSFLYEHYPFLKECPPSYVLRSGISGLHLYFSLQQTEEMWRIQDRLTHCQITKELIEILGGDTACSNHNRYLRVPFSVNCKYNLATDFFVLPENEKVYTKEILREKINKYKGVSEIKEVKKQEVKTKKRETKKWEKRTFEKKNLEKNVGKTEFMKELNYIRLKALKQDLEQWFFWHTHELKGRRNSFFFIYVCLLKKLGWEETAIEDKCIRLNYRLAEPLGENEIMGIVKKKLYVFGNDTIAERLGFTEEEKRKLGCRYSEEERRENHRQLVYKQNQEIKEERRKKREEKEKRIFQIIEENPEASLAQLAKKIGKSKTSVSRWKEKYKKWKDGL